MRIIKEGKADKFIGKCPRCGCEFEFTIRDVEQQDPKHDYEDIVRCPTCYGDLFAGGICPDYHRHF